MFTNQVHKLKREETAQNIIMFTLRHLGYYFIPINEKSGEKNFIWKVGKCYS
jgi:hypothetical protein